MYLDTIPRKSVGKNLRGVAFFLAQEHWVALRDSDLGPQPAECLRQFTSQRTAADDQQTPRTLGQIKNIFVGQKPGVGKPRNRRELWPRAGRDQGFLEA